MLIKCQRYALAGFMYFPRAFRTYVRVSPHKTYRLYCTNVWNPRTATRTCAIDFLEGHPAVLQAFDFDLIS